MSMLESLVNGTQPRTKKDKVEEAVSGSMLEGFADLLYSKENAAYEVRAYLDYLYVLQFPISDVEFNEVVPEIIERGAKSKFRERALGPGGNFYYFGAKNEKEFMKAYDYMARSPEE